MFQKNYYYYYYYHYYYYYYYYYHYYYYARITIIADVINNGQILIYCNIDISCVVSVCLFYCCYIRFLLLYLVVNVKFW